MPNARRACFSIRSYPPSHFQAIECVGNDSKTRNLDSLWFEAKGRWASFFRLWTTASAAKKEGFSSSHRDGWWKMNSLQQPKEKKVMGTARQPRRRRLGRIFTLRRLCCVFCGTRSVLFIMSCWNRTKTSLGNGIERNWCVWAEHCAKNGHNTSKGTKKWFYCMTTIGLTLPNLLKPTWKRSNGKSYPTRRIPQILRRPIITCSGRWHMLWLISCSAHMKTSKNGLIRG